MYSFTKTFTKVFHLLKLYKIIGIFSVNCFLASICVPIFACVINYLPPGVIGRSVLSDCGLPCHIYLFSAAVKIKLLQRIRI